MAKKPVKKETIQEKMWETFNKIAEQSGYQILVSDGFGGQSYGTTAFKNTDKWTPIIKICVWWGDSVSVHVLNRCGSSILGGATVAIYQYKGEDLEKFSEMVRYAIQKWKAYGKKNPYIFTEGEDETERKEF